MYGLGTEVHCNFCFSLSSTLQDIPILTFACLQLEFYSVLHKVNSPLKNHVPEILASGILYVENGTYKIVPWDGKGVPNVLGKSKVIPVNCKENDFPFGVWAKKQYECIKAGLPINEQNNSAGCTKMWPFIITKRCKGKIFAEL